MRLTGILAAAALLLSAGIGAADDGAITLHGRDAKVHGTKLRYEPEPHKQTLGFWTQAGDAAEWSFHADRSGDYDIEVLQGCGAGQGGSSMQVARYSGVGVAAHKMAIMTISADLNLGLPIVAVHLFVFYYGIVADELVRQLGMTVHKFWGRIEPPKGR